MVSSYGGADKVPVNKELVLRARRSNAAFKEYLKKAEKEEKARLASREKEKEEASRKKQTRPTLRSGRRSYKIFREKVKAKKGFIEEQHKLLHLGFSLLHGEAGVLENILPYQHDQPSTFTLTRWHLLLPRCQNFHQYQPQVGFIKFKEPIEIFAVSLLIFLPHRMDFKKRVNC